MATRQLLREVPRAKAPPEVAEALHEQIGALHPAG